MPVYEFKCGECGMITGELRGTGDYSSPRCSHCGSTNTVKVFSLFAGSQKDCGGCTSNSCAGCASRK